MKATLLFLTMVPLLATGCLHPRDPYRTEGQVVNDSKLAKEVKMALKASSVYKFPYVRVATYNGVAQLSGFVVKETQRQEAAELARQIPGLKEVINNISIAAGPANSQLAIGPVYGPHR